jgi:putative nucleotidyltransferase with HDIG domain
MMPSHPAAAPRWRYRVGQVVAAARASLTDADRAEAMAELPPSLQPLFAAMAPRDQVHGLRVLRRIGSDAPVLRQAALLHDAGKAVTPLGTPGRSLVVLAESVGAGRLLELVPLWGRRVRRYRQHPSIGAEMLRRAGADPGLVEIVAEHQAQAPRRPETRQLQGVDRGE